MSYVGILKLQNHSSEEKTLQNSCINFANLSEMNILFSDYIGMTFCGNEDLKMNTDNRLTYIPH